MADNWKKLIDPSVSLLDFDNTKFEEIIVTVEGAVSTVETVANIIGPFLTGGTNLVAALLNGVLADIEKRIEYILGNGAYCCVAHNVTWNNNFYNQMLAKYPTGEDSAGRSNDVQIFNGFLNFPEGNWFDPRYPARYPIKGGDYKGWVEIVRQAALRSNNFFGANTPMGGFVVVFGTEAGKFEELYNFYNKITKIYGTTINAGFLDGLFENFKNVGSKSMSWEQIRMQGKAPPALFRTSISNKEEGVIPTAFEDGGKWPDDVDGFFDIANQPLRKLVGSNGAYFVGGSIGDVLGRGFSNLIKKLKSIIKSLQSTITNAINAVLQSLKDVIEQIKILISAFRDILEFLKGLMLILTNAYILKLSPNTPATVNEADFNNLATEQDQKDFNQAVSDSFLSEERGFFSLLDRSTKASADEDPNDLFDSPLDFDSNSIIAGVFCAASADIFDQQIEKLFANMFGDELTTFVDAGTALTDQMNNSVSDWNNYAAANPDLSLGTL